MKTHWHNTAGFWLVSCETAAEGVEYDLCARGILFGKECSAQLITGFRDSWLTRGPRTLQIRPSVRGHVDDRFGFYFDFFLFYSEQPRCRYWFPALPETSLLVASSLNLHFKGVVLENSMGKHGLDAKTLLRKCIWIDDKLWPLIIFKILKD